MARSSPVGLDIGTRTVHVAQVGAARGQTTVTNFGGVELPPDAVREGEILDAAAVADAVKQLIGSAGIKDKRVMLGVANQRVVVRQVDLPYLEPSELRNSLRYQVQEFIPIPVEDAELDFHVLEDFTAPDSDQRMLRLLLVAAHRDMVANHVEAATRAGLKPIGIDLNPFAVLRSLGDTSAFGSAGEVLVDVGAGVTNIVVHEQGVPRFVRILVSGGGDITEALATGLGIDPNDAERIKRQTGLRASVGTEAAPQIIQRQAGEFVDEVRSSLDYYQAQVGQARVQRVVLSGGGALLTGLTERLATALRLPVEIGNPFEAFPAKGTVYGADQLAEVGPTLATAVGLALGGAA